MPVSRPPMISPELLRDVRARFAHVEVCPFEGPRIYFENAGGALTLKSVVETSATYAAIPDNQGRDNPSARALATRIEQAKADMRVMFNAPKGQFFVGESGTELLFRLIRAAALGTPTGQVLGSTVEHPASRSAAAIWAREAGKTHVLIAHDNATGAVSAESYAAGVSPETRVATILHSSHVTGMRMDVAAISAAIRDVAPDAIIVVDGIQHAPHGPLDIEGYGVDGYVVSPYKMFSRQGYGIAWVSDRLANLPHEVLAGAPGDPWELGSRDPGAYVAFSDVVAYFDWLGGQVSEARDRRARIAAAGEAIAQHETGLTDAILFGHGGEAGLAEQPRITIIGGAENKRREGLICFTVDGLPAPDVVTALGQRGIRTHTRKADLYAESILVPLGLQAAVRVSLCHYNSIQEVAHFLRAMSDVIASSDRAATGQSPAPHDFAD